MKSHKILSSLELSNTRLADDVKKHFKTYLEFINYPNIDFPQSVELKFYNKYNHEKDFIGEFKIPTNENDNYILTLEQGDCIVPRKGILYHEFTHLIDHVIINNHLQYKDRITCLSVISEVRATYCEYLIRANFDNYASNTKINKNSTIISRNYSAVVPLEEEIETYKRQIIGAFNELKPYDPKSYSGLNRILMYYIGLVLFVENNTNILDDMFNEKIKSHILNFLGEDFIKMIELRHSIPLDFNPLNVQELSPIIQLSKSSIDFSLRKMREKFLNKTKLTFLKSALSVAPHLSEFSD